MRLITTQDRQTLYDIAIIYCGSADAAVDISFLNNLSLTSEMPIGTELSLPEGSVKNVVRLYDINSISPATGIETGEIVDTGIGFMAIEIDNIVG